MTDKIFDIILGDTAELEPQEQAYRIAGFILITMNLVINVLFIGISLSKGSKAMASVNTVSVFISIINIFLYLSKSEKLRNVGGSLIVWNICFYIVTTTYLLQGSKNQIVLFPFLILVVNSFFGKNKKYLIINIVVLLVSYILYYYIRFYMFSENLDSTVYICIANDMFAILGTIGFLYFKKTAEKHGIRHKDKQIKTLAREASIDYLTGLKNRRFAINYVKRKTDRKNDFIIICDIDYFKKINDTYGHVCGDYVLTEIANILKHGFRTSDVVCRWGGEEFLIYVNKASIDIVEERLEILRKTIEEKVFTYEDKTFNVTMSFGFSEVDVEIEIENSLKNTDVALYYGKNNGRNMVVNFKNID